jgi:hypothetical protein
MATAPCFLADVSPKELEQYLDKNPEFPGFIYRWFKQNYLNQGKVDRGAVADAARDLNIPPDHLRRILDRPKTVRKYNEALADAARVRKDFLRENEQYVRALNEPYLGKLIQMLWNAPRASLLFQHGATPMATHAFTYAQRVDKWGLWLKGWKREVAAISPAYHDKLMDYMRDDPMFKYARDVAGLPIEPHETMKGWKAFFGWNQRAFNTLNLLRLDDFKSKFNYWRRGLPPDQWDGLAKDIAFEVAHSSGTTVGPETRRLGVSSNLVLAPKLMQASWFKALFDPAKTMGTYWKMLEAATINKKLYVPDWEKRANHMRATNTAAWLTMTAASLALNQALLKATNQAQQVNYHDFTKTDLWRYKWNGWIIRPRGGIENLALLSRIAAMFFPQGRRRYAGMSPSERQQQIVGQYAEYKAHPAISSMLELARGETLYGETVPAGLETLREKIGLAAPAPRKGQVQLTWPEFIAEHGPIFIGGAVHEYYAAMREQGWNVNDLNALFRGLSNPEARKRAALALMGEFVGFGIYKERTPAGAAPKTHRSKYSFSG